MTLLSVFGYGFIVLLMVLMGVLIFAASHCKPSDLE